MGHNQPGSGWLQYMQRLGVTGAGSDSPSIFLCSAAEARAVLMQRLCHSAGARMFGGNGGIQPRRFLGARFGLDLNGVNVTSVATYNAAVATLRSPAGRSNATRTWANPPLWANYSAALAVADPTIPTGERPFMGRCPRARRETSRSRTNTYSRREQRARNGPRPAVRQHRASRRPVRTRSCALAE